MSASAQPTGTHGAGASLRVHALSFSYPSRPLFDCWNADFSPGLHMVCGDDGCGKTTLLRLLAGELQALSGHLQMGASSLADDAAHYRQQMFRTDPTSDAFASLTPLCWFETLRGRYPAFDMARAVNLLERLFLQEHQHKKGHMLSTGSRRKVWLAAALASGATVVLVDQPFASLDTPSIRAVTDLLQQAGMSGRIVVLADHEPPATLVGTPTIWLS